MRRPFAAAAALSVAAAAACSPPAGDGAASSPVITDSVAVWVIFHPDSARSDFAPAISEAALRQRRQRGIDSFDNDRPLPPALVERVAATGARIRHTSRWLRAVSVFADAEALERIVALGPVDRLALVGSLERAGVWDESGSTHDAASVSPSVPGASSVAPRQRQPFDSAFYGQNWRTVRQLDIAPAHMLSFTGNGVRIAILDTGFEPRHRSLVTRNVEHARDFINNDSIVYNEANDPPGVNQARHGTQVWSLLGAFLPDTLVGPAYGAQFILAKVKSEVNATRADEDRWVAAVEWADSLAARLIASALTFRYDFADRPDIRYDELTGDSTLTTRIADEAARRGVLIVNAVGDAGPAVGSLAAPADADSVIAVGAIDSNGQPWVSQSGSSARGPTFDGRIKPEAVALGTGILAASSLSTVAYDIGLSGTSYPTALIAGGAALVMEAWPNLSAAAIRRAIILSSSNANSPDNATGYGTPGIASAILFPDGLQPASIATVDVLNRVTTLAPEFTWRATLRHPAMGSVLYRLEIARDEAFTDIIYSDTVRDASSLRITRALEPTQRLWWRVVAATALGVRRISPPSDTFGVANWVRLVSPDPTQATFVSATRPELTWTPLTAPSPIGPLVYDVEVLSHETGLPVQAAQRNLTTSTVRVAEPLVPNTAYRWRVIARTRQNQSDTVVSTQPFVVTSVTAPPATLLYQNFPNPFPRPALGTTSTRIWFDLAEQATVELVVLDQAGRIVRHLIPAERSCAAVTLSPGIYGRGPPSANPCVSTSWDGRDEAGRDMPRGLYLLRLRASGRAFYKRMLYLPEG